MSITYFGVVLGFPSTMQDTIIFLDFSEDEYAQIVRGIYSPRVSVLFAGSLPELFKLLADKKNPYIVVAFSTRSAFGEQLDQILKTTALHKLSFVFVGQNIQEQEGRIGKAIRHSITLDVPTTSADVLGAIEYLKNHPVGGSVAAEPKQKKIVDLARDPKETVILSVPELCFSSLDKRGLRDVQMACINFLRASSIEDFMHWGVLPENPTVREVASEITSQIGKNGAGHIYRTASISNRILDVLNITGGSRESARGAALLYAWSFADNPRLLLVDYLVPSRANTRREVAARIERSARKISDDLGLTTEGEIVSMMAKLLGDEYQVGEKTDDMISSAIVTTDMVNRACWQNGHWNPRAVNHLMRRFSAAEVPDIHPVILGLTLKMLSEALEGAGAHYLKAQAMRKNPTLVQVEEELKKEIHTRLERPTPLSKLKPGMQISRPLLSFDGRLILSKDTILDEDLIWRIWQLAAIRPMRSICVRLE